MSDDDLEQAGPIDFVIIEFPAGQTNFSGDKPMSW